jgi:SAM-dependent methyltransferase
MAPVSTRWTHTYHRRDLERLLRAARGRVRGAILDVGSKSRRYDHLFSGTVTAVDRVPNEASEIVAGDLDGTLPFPSASFDSVLCIEVLEYVRDVRHAVAELHRVLKDSGTGVLTVPFLYHDHGDRQRFTRKALEEILTIFPTREWQPIGNGWTVIADILLKKTMEQPAGWRRLPGIGVLLCYDLFLRTTRLARIRDPWYSGHFVFVRK